MKLRGSMKKTIGPVVALCVVVTVVALAEGIHGSASLNDPLYPWMGNGGYDAQHYDITLRVAKDHKTLVGTTSMQAIATEDLLSFYLDLGSPDVQSVMVNGAAASFDHQDPELMITPATPLLKNQNFLVTVNYSGTPGSKINTGLDYGAGWNLEDTGGMFAMAEPSAMMNWAAVNDHPADKASFTFAIVAPKEEQAIVNGKFLGRTENTDDTATSRYDIGEATTTYMPAISIGQYELVEGGTVDGVRIRHYLSPNTAPYYKPVLAKTALMIQFFAKRLGAYPFQEYGIITHDSQEGFALENQTLSSFPSDFGYPSNFPAEAVQAEMEEIYAHELAHQWFGAYVSFKDNSQTFVHEGFAQYLGRAWIQESTGRKLTEFIAEDYPGMLYAKDGGYFKFSKNAYSQAMAGKSFNINPTFVFGTEKLGLALDIVFAGTLPKELRQKILDQNKDGLNISELAKIISELPFTNIAVTRRMNRELRRLADPKLPTVEAAPAPGKILAGDDPFNNNVYARGSAALYALHEKVGEELFYKILRSYLGRYHFGTASNEDFLAIVKELGGNEAHTLLEHWLFDDEVPALPELNLNGHTGFPLGADFK